VPLPPKGPALLAGPASFVTGSARHQPAAARPVAPCASLTGRPSPAHAWSGRPSSRRHRVDRPITRMVGADGAKPSRTCNRPSGPKAPGPSLLGGSPGWRMVTSPASSAPLMGQDAVGSLGRPVSYPPRFPSRPVGRANRTTSSGENAQGAQSTPPPAASRATAPGRQLCIRWAAPDAPKRAVECVEARFCPGRVLANLTAFIASEVGRTHDPPFRSGAGPGMSGPAPRLEPQHHERQPAGPPRGEPTRAAATGRVTPAQAAIRSGSGARPGPRTSARLRETPPAPRRTGSGPSRASRPAPPPGCPWP
jgi:hypothetical protein